MDMKKRLDVIRAMRIPKESKIKQLNELLADCLEEMDAQEQNMRPEVESNSAECYRGTKNYLRELQNRSQ